LTNTGGELNTANGAFALFSNTAGNVNTGIGVRALFSNSTGDGNTAMGTDALVHSTIADGNTAIGAGALFTNTTGGTNTAVGDNTLVNNTSGSGNVALGAFAGGGVTTVDNVICIGSNVGGANVANSCFIGNIRDALVAPDAAQVLIDSAGKLGTTSGSSRRFKNDIKPMGSASEAVLALRPVTFYYTGDSTNTPQFGLIAEDVVNVNPGLTVRDKTGELLTVRYEAVNAMLLNEFLKEHRKLEEQQAQISALDVRISKQESTIAEQQKEFQATVSRQEKEIRALTASLNRQRAEIEKVTTQVEFSKAATEFVEVSR
jgi:hypothetical protein